MQFISLHNIKLPEIYVLSHYCNFKLYILMIIHAMATISVIINKLWYLEIITCWNISIVYLIINSFAWECKLNDILQIDEF